MLYNNARVALLGPSASVLENTAAEIESYDVVVRINADWPVPPERQSFIGKRLDVLYHNCSKWGIRDDKDSYLVERYMERDEFSQTKLVCISRHQPQYPRLKEFCDSVGVIVYDIADDYEKVKKQLSFHPAYRPNYGYFALNHILQFDPEELFVTGFTFYRQRYYKNHKETGLGSDTAVVFQNKNNHNPEWELRHFINEVYFKHSCLKIDKALESIVCMEKLL